MEHLLPRVLRALFLFSCVLFAASCFEKDEAPEPDSRPGVQAIGFYSGDDGGRMCRWDNGRRTDRGFRMGSASQSVYCTAMTSSEGNIHAVGWDSNTGLGRPAYWINGIQKELPRPADSDWVFYNSVTASGGKVYVGGSYYLSWYSLPCYWVGSKRVELPLDGQTSDPFIKVEGECSSIAVSGGKVYAAGHYRTVNIPGIGHNPMPSPCYWVDGVFMTPDMPVWESTGECKSIIVSDGKIYIFGRIGSRVCYWADGARTDLPYPEYASNLEFASMCVSEGKVHVAITCESVWGTGSIAYYWNGSEWVMFSNRQNYDSSTAFSIKVICGKVHITGSYNNRPCYWVDGERVDLSAPASTTRGYCYSLEVN